MKKPTILKEVVKGLWVGVHEPKSRKPFKKRSKEDFKKEKFSASH